MKSTFTARVEADRQRYAISAIRVGSFAILAAAAFTIGTVLKPVSVATSTSAPKPAASVSRTSSLDASTNRETTQGFESQSAVGWCVVADAGYRELLEVTGYCVPEGAPLK